MRPVGIAVFSLAALMVTNSIAHSKVVASGDEPATTPVPYGDLDLSTPLGLQTLNGRVARAASQLCSDNAKKGLEEIARQRRCLDSTLRKAKVNVQRAAEQCCARIRLVHATRAEGVNGAHGWTWYSCADWRFIPSVAGPPE